MNTVNEQKYFDWQVLTIFSLRSKVNTIGKHPQQALAEIIMGLNINMSALTDLYSAAHTTPTHISIMISRVHLKLTLRKAQV